MKLPILAPPTAASLIPPTDGDVDSLRVFVLGHHHTGVACEQAVAGLERTRLDVAIAAGEGLNLLKARLAMERKSLEPGSAEKREKMWLAWCAKNLPELSRSTIGNYTLVARHRPKVSSAGSLREALAICAEIRLAQKRQKQRENPPRLNGHFSPIVVDPPWPLDERGTVLPYDTMSLRAICDFQINGRPMREVAAEDAVLFLWTVHAFADEAYDVLRAWGFEYAGREIVWVKDVPGLHPYLPSRHETAIVGVRGKPVLHPGRDTVLFAPRRAHSQKPDEFYDLVENLCPSRPESRLEMFAREHRPGWVCWGDQLPAGQPGAEVMPLRAAARAGK